MATYNEVKMESMTLLKHQNSLECCDICGSTDIAETKEGFTCRNCGIVLEIQKYEYHRPYDADIVQYAVLGKTQMGSRRERLQLKNSTHIEQLSKLDAIRSSHWNCRRHG